jgi:hypothetical protein
MTRESGSLSMSERVQDLLRAFDGLGECDQREFATEILQRTRESRRPPLDDEAVDRIADESFLDYDVREVADVRG